MYSLEILGVTRGHYMVYSNGEIKNSERVGYCSEGRIYRFMVYSTTVIENSEGRIYRFMVYSTMVIKNSEGRIHCIDRSNKKL